MRIPRAGHCVDCGVDSACGFWVGKYVFTKVVKPWEHIFGTETQLQAKDQDQPPDHPEEPAGHTIIAPFLRDKWKWTDSDGCWSNGVENGREGSTPCEKEWETS